MSDDYQHMQLAIAGTVHDIRDGMMQAPRVSIHHVQSVVVYKLCTYDVRPHVFYMF